MMDMAMLQTASVAQSASTSIEIFPLDTHDVPWLVALEARSQKFPWLARHFMDSFVANHDAWGIRWSGQAVGFAFMLHAPDASHLLNVAVEPELRRKGLGVRLLRHVMRRAAAAGNTEMFLEVRASNDMALALYRRLGFRQVGLRKDYYPASAETGMRREHALVLQASLTGEST
jgi:tRNA threonylcarbamoyladenosine biosynthesis protein TsaB